MIALLRSIYQLRITLLDVQPPTWRTVWVANSDDLASVSIAFQIAMGWTNSHLHLFVKNGRHYGQPDPDSPGSHIFEEDEYRIRQLLQHEGDQMLYLYDLGDYWEHEVVLEKILPFDFNSRIPVCQGGAFACPPEDVGGPPGYEQLLESIQDPGHPQHLEMLEWVGADFDPEQFDLEETNELLREYL